MRRSTSYTLRMRSLKPALPASTTHHALVVALTLLTAAMISTGSVAFAQENPYGEVDPAKANVSLLQSTVGSKGSPIGLSLFDRFDPAEVDRLFQALLDHPIPSMRTLAGVSLVKRGESLPLIAARMNSEEAAGALVIGSLASQQLDREDAIVMVDGDLAIPLIARTIAHARAGRTSDLEALSTITADSTLKPLARGIAAAAIEEESPGSVERWLESMDNDPKISLNQRDRKVFEMIQAARNLKLKDGLKAIEVLNRDRPPNDGLRAAAVLALLETDPAQGRQAWQALLASPESSTNIIPIALLLVAADAEAPLADVENLPTADPLQKDIKALVISSPEDRPAAAIAAVRRGHVPTMRWLVELPDDRMPIETLEAIIERGTRSRRAVMIDLLADASEALARLAPEKLIEPLRQAEAKNDLAVSEVLLRGLIAAGSESAAEAARNSLQASRKQAQSLALLAIACGADPDEASLRRLGRIAAGGGDLPQDLRPLAAWHHLRHSGRLDESLPQIMAP